MLAGADALAVVIAADAVALLNRPWSVPVAALSVALWILLAKLFGLYDQDHRALRHQTIDELRTILAWSATGTASVVLLQSAVSLPATTAHGTLHFWLLVTFLATALRATVRAAWRRLTPRERALLVGSGPLKAATGRKLELFTDIHVDCVETFDPSALVERDGSGRVAELLRNRIESTARLDRIIVATDHIDEALIAVLVALCRRYNLKLSVVPPARGIFGTAVQLHHIADLPLIEYSTWETARSTRLLKRGFDVVVSVGLLLLTAPLLLLIAASIALTSRGPIFFVQRRAGLNGRPFPMVKFRTMCHDAEARVHEVVNLDEIGSPAFKVPDDPRVTRVGRLLRRFSLDELPQLWNVLRGQMSMVGPRPEDCSMVSRYLPEHRLRLKVKPGLTGPMQVYGRGDLTFEERLAVEREYVENPSLGRDLRVLLLTIPAVVGGRGAY